MRDQKESPEGTVERITRSFRYLADERKRLYFAGDKHETPNLEENNLSNTQEAVHHPVHYNSDPSGVEAITVCEHRNFCIGNAIKYLWRAGMKGDTSKHIEDLHKAIWYINREIERLGKFGK